MVKLSHNIWCDVVGQVIPRICTHAPHTNGWYKVNGLDYTEDGTPAPHNPDAPRIERAYELWNTPK